MLGKGQKRKRTEEEMDPAPAVPSSSLFSISVSKLHWSLQRGEPDLRHLVLVANTLRRMQDEMELASLSVLQQVLCVEAWLDDSNSLPGPCRGPPVLPPSFSPVDQLLRSSMDASVFSILQDLTSGKGFSDPLWPAMVQAADSLLCKPSPESGQTALPCLAPLELMGPGQTLLQEGLDGIFEDINTSMYDGDPWPPSKEACSSTEVGRQDFADLDYFLDVLVRTEGL